MSRSKGSQTSVAKQRAAQAARSASARKGWETRRENARQEARAARRRSEAARRGWETRRLEAARQKRSEAARKGWETRREKQRAMEVRIEEHPVETISDVEDWIDRWGIWEDEIEEEDWGDEEWESTADYEESPK